MSRTNSDQSVSSKDVAEYLQDLTRRWGGYFSYYGTFDVNRSGQVRLSFVLERREHVVLSQCVAHPRRVWGYFPCDSSRTITGLLFRLCYELDEKLAEAEQLAQSELPF